MKKILSLLAFFVLSFLYTFAQKQPYTPYRTNGVVMVKDSALAVGQFLIPTFTSPSLGAYSDRWGQSFGVNRSSRSLNVRGNGTFLIFPDSLGIRSMINTISSDTTANLYRTVNNSLSLTQLQTKLNGYLPLTGGVLSGQLQTTRLAIGGANVSTVSFYNRTALSGGSNVYANRTSVTMPANITNNVYGNYTDLSTDASIAIGTAHYYYAFQGSIGAGGSVSTQNAFEVASNFIGATNNNGFTSAIPAGTGRRNLNITGTAVNYLEGNSLFGTITDNGEKLQVNGKATVSAAPTNPTDVVRKTDLDGAVSGAAVTASNGLTKTVNNIALGGALTSTTTIGQLSTINRTSFTLDNSFIDFRATGSALNIYGSMGVNSGSTFMQVNQASGIKAIQIGAATGNMSITDQIQNIGLVNAVSLATEGKKRDTWLAEWGAVKTRVDSLGSLVGRVSGANTWTNTNIFNTGITVNSNIITNNGSFPRTSIGGIGNNIAISDDAVTYQNFTPLKQVFGNNGSNLDIKPPAAISTIRTQTYQDASGTIALTSDIAAYANSLSVTNTTSTSFTKSTLNSTYSTAPIRFKVVCPNISTVYEKYDASNWFAIPITILP